MRLGRPLKTKLVSNLPQEEKRVVVVQEWERRQVTNEVQKAFWGPKILVLDSRSRTANLTNPR